MSSSMTRRTCCVALLAAACTTPAAWAQGTAAPAAASQAAASASASASTAAIALPDVVAQAESAASTLGEIAADATPDPATAAIARDLPALTGEIDARLDETAQTVEGSTSLDKLRSFEADWRTLTKDLAPWRDRLGQHGEQEDRLEVFGRLQRFGVDRLRSLCGRGAVERVESR